jgi:hypothetical protein
VKEDGKIKAALGKDILEVPPNRVIETSETQTLRIMGVNTYPHFLKIPSVTLTVCAGPGHIGDCVALCPQLPENLHEPHVTSTAVWARQSLVDDEDMELGS